MILGIIGIFCSEDFLKWQITKECSGTLLTDIIKRM